MPVVRGLATLSYVDPADGSALAVAAMREATLSVETEALAAANPDTYGWAHSVPGTQRWTVSASVLHAVASGATSRAASQVRLDRLAMGRAVLAVLFQTNYGAEYSGLARVERWETRAAVGAAAEGTYALVGVGPLDLADAGAPCGQSTASGGSGVTTTAHALGASPGTVTLSYNAYAAQDAFEILYDGVVVATTNGPVGGSGTLSFEYAAEIGRPRSCQVRVTGASSGTQWDYVLGCPA